MALWIFVLVFALAQTEATDISLKGQQIYRLQNREDSRLYLTAIGVLKSGIESAIVSDLWRGASTQKWRLISIDPSMSLIELRPTSSESRVMAIDSQNPTLVSQTEYTWYNRIGISNSIHQWTVSGVEGGFVQLRNYKTMKCLQSFGTGKQIGTANCVNSLRQQWLFELL